MYCKSSGRQNKEIGQESHRTLFVADQISGLEPAGHKSQSEKTTMYLERGV